MSADFVDWHDEHELDHRRRLRNAMLVSLAIHGVLMGAFAFSSAPHVAKMPEVISVELIGPPLAASSAPKSSAAPKSPRAAAPKPAAPAPPPPPEPEAPAPPPPTPKAPVQVLPEEAPSKIAKVEPKPKPRPKPEPKPPPRRTPEKALSHEDALAALMDELGGDEVSDSLQKAPSKEEPAEPATSGGTPGEGDRREGAKMDSDMARWMVATHRRIQDKWVTPPHLRGRGLATSLELRLSASGAVVGEPKVVGSSGDPNFDDNAVRGVLKAAPLPPPPRGGSVTFIFRSEAE